MARADYDLIQREVANHHYGNRTESAALLAWFLSVVWRLEPAEVDDAICDGGGDKGIDALLVNDDIREIAIFQSKHFKKASGKQGDKDIKNLFGAAAYFKTASAVDGLLGSAPNVELSRLLQRQQVRERVADGAHVTRLVFVTDGALDPAGRSYVEAMAGGGTELEVWDQLRIGAVAERTQAPELRPGVVKLKAASPPTKSAVGTSELAIALIPARELVANLPDIDNLLLFDRNVRLSEGRTRVNKELATTVRDQGEHSFFPAYHNGITVLTHGLKVSGSRLRLSDVTVVNGCQSLLTLSEHKKDLTDDLHVLVKVVEVPERSELIQKITYRSNNQNPIDMRDQRSTDIVQRDLQRAVEERYGSTFSYEIRQGEQMEDGQTLDNQHAAQMLVAVYLREPWNAVRKVRLFDSDYHRIFNRRVTADRLFLLRQISDVVTGKRDRLRTELAGSFSSIRFTLAYLLVQAVAESERGQGLLEDPGRWLPEKLSEVSAALASILDEIVDSVNFYIEEEESDQREKGLDFDPKVAFKSQGGVQKIENMVLRDYRRLAKRDRSYHFGVAPKP